MDTNTTRSPLRCYPAYCEYSRKRRKSDARYFRSGARADAIAEAIAADFEADTDTDTSPVERRNGR